MKNTLENWLILHFSGIRSLRVKELLEQFGDAEALVNADKKDLQAWLPKTAIEKIKAPNSAHIKKALNFSQKSGQHIIPFDHPYYPPLLKEISDPPLLLYCLGQAEIFRETIFAIVGTRNPSFPGAENAFHFSSELSRYFVIASGMAIGIDGESHRGALSTQGKTIAVLGSGLSTLYPKRHRALAEEIAATGAIISEFSLDTPPMAAYFPQRNRIISGISIGTLVVEAALRSGSLITARLAMEQNREVFAIPGSIHAPQSRGCHSILKNGATLVENVEDILTELGHFTGRPATVLQSHIPHLELEDAQKQIVLDAIGFDQVSVDQLVSRLGLGVGCISALLISLELEGYIKPIAGGYRRVSR